MTENINKLVEQDVKKLQKELELEDCPASLEKVMINLFSDKKVQDVIKKSVVFSSSCGVDWAGCTRITFSLVDKENLEKWKKGVEEYAKQKENSEDEKTAHC